MKKIILTVLLISTFIISNAQRDTVYRFNLTDAVSFALDNNLLISNSELEIKKAKWKVWETTAIGLPQVNGSIQYQNFPNIPTQMMPDFLSPVIYNVNRYMFGLQPLVPLDTANNTMPVQFGSQHNADWGITISQIIFSGEYIIGLQAAKTFKMISEQNLDKAIIELKASVEQAYYLLLIAKQSLSIIEQNAQNISKLAADAQKIADAGVTDQTQADQLKILELNLKNQISSLKRQEELASLMLNFQLGLSPYDSVILLTNLDEVIQNIGLQPIAQTFNINNNIDYQMMNTQLKLKQLDLRRSEMKLMPSIGGFYSYSKKAMLDEFDFFEESTEWFPTSVVGIKIEIPIFSSGQRFSVIQQRKIDVLQTMNQKSLLEQQLNIQYIQTRNDYLNAFDNLISQEKNKNLSEKIYKDTQLKYQQGTASSMDLTQTQNQYLQAQANYYQAIMQLLNAKTKLEKLLNN